MAVSVPLEFIPPTEPDLAVLHIWESNNSVSGFVEIDSTTAVGTYPDYITRFTTLNATAIDDWFAIQWQNTAGVLSDLSAPVKGGTKTLVGIIVERVMLRDSGANEQIVAEEAEALIYKFKKVDPYTLLDTDLTIKEIKAITDLTLVAIKYPQILTQSLEASSYTAGIVSESRSANTNSSLLALKALERKAMADLGLGGSLIGQLVDRTGRLSITGTKTVLDSSRLLAVTAIITEEMVEREIT